MMNVIKPGLMSSLNGLQNANIAAPVTFVQTAMLDNLQKAIYKRGTKLTINSGLRVLPQQLILYQWYLNKACGIPLAARPGRSNHESGLAIDVNDASGWVSAMEQHGFKFFGPKDPVHFDYVAGGTSITGTTVLAFQKLWNCNNPGDKISEDGIYGSGTESRLLKSPADGFAKVC